MKNELNRRGGKEGKYAGVREASKRKKRVVGERGQEQMRGDNVEEKGLPMLQRHCVGHEK